MYPKQHLSAIAKRYPSAWRTADQMRAERGRCLPDWPTWCYLPLSGWFAIITDAMRLSGPTIEAARECACLGALGTWRVTQGIYRYDPTLFAALIETPVDGDLPHDLLYHLPEWCVYVETPGMAWCGHELQGFFAHLESDANSGRPELRLMLNTATGLFALPLHLGPWSLAQSLALVADEASRQASLHGNPSAAAEIDSTTAPAAVRTATEPLLSLLLYLCSQAAEIGADGHHPANPVPKRTKQGWRLFAPDHPTTWDVGTRIGAALRRGYHAAEIGDGTHAGPRPHIRRAHWHGFRTGPQKRGDGTLIAAVDRPIALRWLPPIPVNVDDADALPVVVRPVR